MRIDKYIFVIFPSIFVIRSFRGMSVRRGGQGRPSILKFDIFPSKFLVKRCFLTFEWWKSNFAAFVPPCKKYFGPPLENVLLARPWKKSWHSCLGVHAHLLKCWRGTWTEKVWEPLA